MAKTYRVLPEWFIKKDHLNYIISSWCKKKSNTEVLCLVCDKEISCERKGIAALTQHAKSSIHIKNANLKLSSQQLVLKPRESGSSSCVSGSRSTALTTSSNGPLLSTPPYSTLSNEISLFHPKEPTARAELIWAMKSVVSNIAPSVCDDLNDVFNAMFPHAVPEDFSLGRTKLSYLVTDALGPYFYNLLIHKAKNTHYALLYDETTNHSNQKELQFAIRFWSDAEKEIVSPFKNCFFGACHC